jgi:protein-tyrosine-phosphatase
MAGISRLDDRGILPPNLGDPGRVIVRTDETVDRSSALIGTNYAAFLSSLQRILGVKRVLVIGGNAVGCGFMTAAYLRRFAGSRVEVFRDRSDAQVDPHIRDVLIEDGLLLSDMRATIVDIHMGEPFDLVVSLTDDGNALLPHVSGRRRMRASFEEPRPGRDPAAREELYRLRNEIRSFSSQIVAGML